ncbi:hypothetical protein ACP4OV_029258 [Aristida adscensionis]
MRTIRLHEPHNCYYYMPTIPLRETGLKPLRLPQPAPCIKSRFSIHILSIPNSSYSISLEKQSMAPKISLKLLVDTKSKKVLFAEAGKEFVDFVFGLLTLPIGAVAKLISAGTMHGSVGRLYQSVDHIAASYLLPGADKADLLHPKLLHPDAPELLLLQGGDAKSEDGGAGAGAPPPALGRFKLYTCAGYCATATVDAKAACPQCKKAMATEVAFVLPSSSSSAAAARGASPEESGGYVKGLVTYMVTDGLEVTPMSAISSISLINKFSVGKDAELAEKVVTVGMDEGLALLKAALRSDTVLSDVFMARKKCAPTPCSRMSSWRGRSD